MGAEGSKFAGEGQRLGSFQDPPQPRRPPQPESRTLPRQIPSIPVPPPAPAPTCGGGGRGAGGGAGEEDAAKRAAALAAAERRRQDGLKRGTQTTNANQGVLSKELDRQKYGQSAGPALPDRVVWD